MKTMYDREDEAALATRSVEDLMSALLGGLDAREEIERRYFSEVALLIQAGKLDEAEVSTQAGLVSLAAVVGHDCAALVAMPKEAEVQRSKMLLKLRGKSYIPNFGKEGS